ncbi:hypothetical protein IFM89_009297 [Coptis chinensis]|uniref:H(+)-transporting two-sector ATPase n=1 Tax=Coptis chinensis TaxID=261450 RepID=A0A835IIW5_9MAGN|nr:hypothetical protein IFM89_009297 [Coptis chinensis]
MGIKVVDLLAPYRRGGKKSGYSGAGVGKTVLIMELINNIAKAHGESKVALVYGRMNEPPGARMRVGLTALTMAEYFRDVNEQGVLLFIDNIFRLVKRDPKRFDRPAPATTFAHLDATTVLSRGMAAKGIYPAVDPLDSTLTMLQPRIVEVKEIILSTNSGQIGVLSNQALLPTAVDIGILRIRLNDQWLTIALMGGFARIGNNEIAILVNDAERGSDIDPQEAQKTLEIAEANLSSAEGKRQTIEANLALRRARTRVEAINAIS